MDEGIRIDLPIAPCSSYREMLDENHLVGKHLYANGFLARRETRDVGTTTMVTSPNKYKGTPNQPASHDVPDVGEHTKEMLKAFGYGDAELAELMAEKGAAPPPRGPHAKKRD